VLRLGQGGTRDAVLSRMLPQYFLAASAVSFGGPGSPGPYPPGQPTPPERQTPDPFDPPPPAYEDEPPVTPIDDPPPDERAF
jgi:hypothetical protein